MCFSGWKSSGSAGSFFSTRCRTFQADTVNAAGAAIKLSSVHHKAVTKTTASFLFVNTYSSCTRNTHQNRSGLWKSQQWVFWSVCSEEEERLSVHAAPWVKNETNQ